MICTNVAVADTKEFAIKIPKEIMEQAVAANDATVLIKDYFIPFLQENDMAAIILGSEINISNGRTTGKSQYDRDGLEWAMSQSDDAKAYFEKRLAASNEEPIPFGERGMLGKLIYAPSVLLEYDSLLPNVDFIRDEAIRLLVGPWLYEGRGTISFTFAEVSNRRVLSYDTCTWSKPVRHILAIKITHVPEYMGISHPAVVGILKRLEAKGILYSEFDHSDKRIKRVILTERGKDLCKEIGYFKRKVEERLMKGFDNSEIILLRQMLDKLKSNME
jgi:DNA-binding MarR family transcriptional regulator